MARTPSSPLSRNKNGGGLRCSAETLMVVALFSVLQLVLLNAGFFQTNDGTGSQAAQSPTQSFTKIAPLSSANDHRHRRTSGSDPNADGTFNGHPVYHHETSTKLYSNVHCVGENYQEDKSWMHRSCHYTMLCFDMEQQDFVIYEDPAETKIHQYLTDRPFLDVSQSYIRHAHNNSVSLGGINPKWGNGIGRIKWQPRIDTSGKTPSSFYALPDDVVMVPFHSLSGSNPGHLVWDDFLPVHTLLDMFQLGHADPLMIRYILPDTGLWASCDWNEENTEMCAAMHKKFWPLMSANRDSKITTIKNTELILKKNAKPQSNLVCARHGAAGIGSLTDHGTTKLHGWVMSDYETTQNHGRGGILWNFRQNAMRNVGILERPLQKPYKIVFSKHSSKVTSRRIDFSKQIDALNQALDPKEAVVESYTMKDLSLKEQLELASQTAIFITGCGGGAVSATYLPRGSSVFLYYVSDGGVEKNKRTYTPARLDWDLFNNLGYLRVQWHPRKDMNNYENLGAFVALIKHELAGIQRDNS